MNNFSFESESLEKRTVWASFYRWESFRIMVLHKVRKCSPGIQKSWESSRCWRHLTEQSGQKPVKLCARCNRWWCSVNKFIVSCNNRIECSTRQQFIFGGVWVLKKEKKSTKFSQRLQSFLQEIFFQGEETGNKANPPDSAPKMKRLRQGNGDKLFTREEWLSVVQIAWYCSRLSALDMANLPNGVVSVSLEDECTINTSTMQRQWRRDFR